MVYASDTIPFPLAPPPCACLKNSMAPGATQNDTKNGSSLPPEELLVRIGKDKDRKAFVALFSHYAPRIKSFLLKYGMDEAQAEEIVQNVFVTVWEKAEKYDPQKAAASTWLFTIARNKRIDAMRKDKFITFDSDMISNTVPAPEKETYAETVTVEKLSKAIDSLPKEQAALLRMSFFEDKPHSEIAEETNLPLGTVKSRLRLALNKLRNFMKMEDT